MLVNANSTVGTLHSQVNDKLTFVCLTSRKPHLLPVSREPGFCARGQWLPRVLKNCVRMMPSLLLQGETNHTTYHRRMNSENGHPGQGQDRHASRFLLVTWWKGKRSARTDVSSKLLGLNLIWVLKKLYFEINFTCSLCVGKRKTNQKRPRLGKRKERWRFGFPSHVSSWPFMATYVLGTLTAPTGLNQPGFRLELSCSKH